MQLNLVSQVVPGTAGIIFTFLAVAMVLAWLKVVRIEKKTRNLLWIGMGACFIIPVSINGLLGDLSLGGGTVASVSGDVVPIDMSLTSVLSGTILIDDDLDNQIVILTQSELNSANVTNTAALFTINMDRTGTFIDGEEGDVGVVYQIRCNPTVYNPPYLDGSSTQFHPVVYDYNNNLYNITVCGASIANSQDDVAQVVKVGTTKTCAVTASIEDYTDMEGKVTTVSGDRKDLLKCTVNDPFNNQVSSVTVRYSEEA